MANQVRIFSEIGSFIDVDTGKSFTYDNHFYNTYTDYETIFVLPILETGWIYDVYLLIDGNAVKAYHLRRGFMYDNKDEIYSFFIATYIFPHSCKSIEACWRYDVNGVTYFSEPFCFSVEEFYDSYIEYKP